MGSDASCQISLNWSCGNANHGFTRGNIPRYHGASSYDGAAANVQARKNRGTHTNECIGIDDNFSCKMRSGCDMHRIAQNTVVIDGGCRVYDYGMTEFCVGAYRCHGKYLGAGADRGAFCDKGALMRNGPRDKALHLEPVLQFESFQSTVAADRNAEANFVMAMFCSPSEKGLAPY
jgi:hypothetical protein